MADCIKQRQHCQALLAQLKQSQNLIKDQILNGTTRTKFSSTLPPNTFSQSSSSVDPQALSGILKKSTNLSSFTNDTASLNANNSARIDSDSNATQLKTSTSLTQGILTSQERNNTGFGISRIDLTSDTNNMDFATNVNRQQTTLDSSQMAPSLADRGRSTTRTSGQSTITTQDSQFQGSMQINKASSSTSPTRQHWRDILNRHVTVDSELSPAELRELDSSRVLNFSYGADPDTSSHAPTDSLTSESGAPASFKRQALSVNGGEETENYERRAKRETTVCTDITNKPVSVTLSDMMTRRKPLREKVGLEQCPDEVWNTKVEAGRKKVKFFREQLEDDGNNRKLNSFTKDASIKPKSLLNSTTHRSLCPSKQNSSSPEITAEDQRLLGYDWIAALLDNEPGLVDQSESFFNELKDFRRAFKSECSNNFYREGPHTLVEFEPEPVAEALAETKVHPYIVNERLFTQPFKNGLIDYEDERTEQQDGGLEKKSPTEENPRFVRVSVPRSTLTSAYKSKPHRRRSFDGSDSCSLIDHCLLGWENTRPAMIPTARALDLNTEAGKRTDSQVTSLSEAERVAAEFASSNFQIGRPPPRANNLPRWRKHYMETTLNLSQLGLGSDLSATSLSSTGPGEVRDVKRATDKILRATYSTMYEMERLRREREQELERQEG